MPKQSKPQASKIPPARLIPGTKDPILSTGPPKDAEDWRIKNARAKELIMSTLVPGSEPWKIAEPLELASDIWKALEARYAPKEGKANAKMGGKSTETESRDTGFTHRLPLAPEPEIDPETKQREEAKARAVKEFYASMPDRDQRFLWALLHGGKEETNAWFYGTENQT